MDIVLQLVLGFGGIVLLGLVAIAAIGAALMKWNARQMRHLS